MSIGGQDVLAGLSGQYILQFSYTDNTSDKADDISIELADPARTWMLRYLPTTKTGVKITAGIQLYNWSGPGDNRKLDCGIFYINDVELKGPPNTVSIKATSIPANGIKGQKKFKAWENKDLKSIAGEIATNNNLTLFYDATDNPIVKRTDQADQADLEYLRERCKEAKLSMKIHKDQLIVYSEEEYEARAPAFTLIYGKSNIMEYEFSAKSDDTYKKAKNSYINPETGKVTDTEFADTSKDSTDYNDADLINNEEVENEPDTKSNGSRSIDVRLSGEDFIDTSWDNDPAKNAGKGAGSNKNSVRKCKAKLREKNKKSKQSSITIVGNISYLSGLNLQTVGFGTFDRKWFIETSVHEIANGGYSTKLSLRGALTGY